MAASRAFLVASVAAARAGSFFGFNAGHTNSGANATGLGYSAGYQNTGNYLTAVGIAAGYVNTGASVAAVGYNAGRQNSGDNSAFLGAYAGYQNTGFNTVGVGESSGYQSTATYATYVGRVAGYQNTGGNAVIVGSSAGMTNSSANVTFVGTGTGSQNTGASNTYIGYNAGSTATVSTTGDNNIAIGAATTFPSRTASNQLNIGNAIYGSLSNKRLSIGISSTSIGAGLQVSGTISATNAIMVGQSSLTCATGISGSIRYETTSDTIQLCNGAGWVSLASGTTGGGGATDNITSGTTKVTVNSDTATISFTTNGSVANYVDSSGRLVTTGISVTTNQLSATTGSFSRGIASTNSGLSTAYYASTYGNIAFHAVTGAHGTAADLLTDGSAGITLKVRGASGSKLVGFYPANVLSSIVDDQGRFGIGMVTPTATLQVSGSFIVSNSTQTTTPTLYISSTAATPYIGIGTNAPATHLSVVGSSGMLSDADYGSLYHQLLIGGAGTTTADAANAILMGSGESANNPVIRMKTSGNDKGYIGWSSSQESFFMGVKGPNGMPLKLKTNGLDRLTVLYSSGNIGIGNIEPSRTLHVSGTALTTSWTGINFSSAANVTPTAPLEVSGTVSATRFVGDGSLLSNLPGGGGATDNITSGTTKVTVNSATATISFTTNGSVANYLDSSGRLIGNGIGLGTSAPSATLDVSGTMKLSGGTGSETCDSTQYGLLRRNPTTGALQMCVSR